MKRKHQTVDESDSASSESGSWAHKRQKDTSIAVCDSIELSDPPFPLFSHSSPVRLDEDSMATDTNNIALMFRSDPDENEDEVMADVDVETEERCIDDFDDEGNIVFAFQDEDDTQEDGIHSDTLSSYTSGIPSMRRRPDGLVYQKREQHNAIDQSEYLLDDDDDTNCSGAENTEELENAKALFHRACIMRVAKQVFVLAEFTKESSDLLFQVQRWVHITYISANSQTDVLCSCTKSNGECDHSRTFRAILANPQLFSFPPLLNQVDSPHDIDIVQFYTDESTLYFSVAPEVKQLHRVVVTAETKDLMDNKIILSCTSCHLSVKHKTCFHTRLVETALYEDLECQTIGPRRHLSARHERKPISFSRIPPPKSLFLDQDVDIFGDLAHKSRVFDDVEPLLLDNTSRCRCGELFDSCRPIETITAKLFTEIGAVNKNVEVQRCPKCNPSVNSNKWEGWIGPDGCDRGIFNWNNHFLYTHQLLNEYTISFAESEETLGGFCRKMKSKYVDQGSNFAFTNAKTFTKVWFAFRGIQNLSLVICPKCGIHPKIVVGDGISLAYPLRFKTGLLHAPTTTNEFSSVKQNVRRWPSSPICNREVRKCLRVSVTQFKATRVLNIDKLLHKLKAKAKWCQRGTDNEAITLVKRLVRLLHQTAGTFLVDRAASYVDIVELIACNESILTILREDVSQLMMRFIASNASDSVEILKKLERGFPVFGKALRWLFLDRGQFKDPWLVDVGKWFLKRRHEVKSRVTSYLPDPIRANLPDNWQQSSSRYSMPPVRARPVYPQLEEQEVIKPTGDGCTKHFADYAISGLTGGCQVLCCSHRFFYGFHFFDSFEGRNDMFSAIYTRFPTAPEVVVHDFACALGDYCLSREPQYFENTLFVVDKFHSGNHKACTQSSKIYAYVSDPAIEAVNSNAAEHLNSGLKRLRTSMSGMGESRSIIYMNTYVCVRNRLLLQKGVQNEMG
ncbi:hypothetical protein BCR33DRAFT_698914 [Rhizoclosmatium globosum]|uniref:HMG domain-containing protein n=1 Tax=Rhizoclosmatium globosum TaxID=329046 RepID=A0A1Y2C517_9FUNG|nr:hypothetical protein BCR33DRAFT_698914 [Rhizoclosmatium globosum]|eukprot:ORY41974.1 hypothetical protein BCR33DRAFT_698914 [Rhizoclosmatium globosum]